MNYDDLKLFYNAYAFGDKSSVYIFMGSSKDDLESVRGLLKQGKKFAAIDGKYETVTGIELIIPWFLKEKKSN